MRKLFLLVPALLLAGCRGEQVAFQFQPAPATSVPVAATPAVAATVAPAALATEIPATSQPTTMLARAKPVRPRRLAGALKALPQSTLAALAAPKRAGQQLTQHLGRRHPTEGAAESGLGRVALFFIGVALAVVAGLAALVNLIFSIGFFTALGYTAAGLVVLFVLYSLLSGGKKAS
jgi:hypothetical protein